MEALVGSSQPDRELTRKLYNDGYAFFPGWQAHATTREVASSVGTIVDIDKLLPGSGIPTIQTLRPCKEDEAPKTRYSGVFGLNEFPLHTDLAHWARPPRYLLLRCLRGSAKVATRLLPASALTNAIDSASLRRALLRPRRPSRFGKMGLLKLMVSQGETLGLRWDPLFLEPMNASAHEIMGIMTDCGRTWDCQHELYLHSYGDTLIIDNWRMLHGRSRAIAEPNRLIERAYLSEVIL